MFFWQFIHNLFEYEICVALTNSTEILAILISETIIDKSYDLVHTLVIGLIWMIFQIDKNYSSQTISVCLWPSFL